MQQCFVMPLDKDRVDRFTAPLCSLFWFSKACWFNKFVPFDAQGLNPLGEAAMIHSEKKKKKSVLASSDCSLTLLTSLHCSEPCWQ